MRRLGIPLVVVAGAAGVALLFPAHRGVGRDGRLAGIWLVLLVANLAIAMLVRRLGRTPRHLDRRFRSGFESSPVAAAFLDPELRITDVNDAMCRMLGRSREVLLASSVLGLGGPPRTAGADAARLRLAIEGGSGEWRTGEEPARFSRPDGSTVWAEVAPSPVAPVTGRAYRFCQFREVTELRRAGDLLARQAIRDPLTGLYNEAVLLDCCKVALARQDPGRSTVGLVMLDLDQFKTVNDSLGYATGDVLLAGLAQRLAAAVSGSDTIARLGGARFAVLVDGLAAPFEAVERARRLAVAIAEPIGLAGGGHVMTASIGVAVARPAGDDPRSLLREAETAVSRAKAGGRDRIEVFDPSLRTETLRRLRIEHDLRAAIAGGGLLLDYQPVVHTTTGKPVFLEALVRWQHPLRGRIGPNEFVPIAERTGLILELGEWVLRTAIAQLAKWQLVYLTEPPLMVSVNVSGSQLAAPGFSELIAQQLRASAIAPGTLGIEVTESVLRDVASARETLEALRALGVVVLLDGFGSGSSSLACLEQFPIDVLKIDHSFVVRLDEGPDRTVVLAAIVAIARALRLAVIASGVESPGQIGKLRELGCPWAQGIAIAPPLAVEQVVRFLTEHQTVARAIEHPDQP